MATKPLPELFPAANDNIFGGPPTSPGALMRAGIAISRRAIEAEIERLIALLDAADGDDDLEDDREDDPLDHGEEDESRGLILPIYDVDQSTGPVNERQMLRDHHERLRSVA